MPRRVAAGRRACGVPAARPLSPPARDAGATPGPRGPAPRARPSRRARSSSARTRSRASMGCSSVAPPRTRKVTGALACARNAKAPASPGPSTIGTRSTVAGTGPASSAASARPFDARHALGELGSAPRMLDRDDAPRARFASGPHEGLRRPLVGVEVSAAPRLLEDADQVHPVARARACLGERARVGPVHLHDLGPQRGRQLAQARGGALRAHQRAHRPAARDGADQRTAQAAVRAGHEQCGRRHGPTIARANRPTYARPFGGDVAQRLGPGLLACACGC